MNGIEQRANAMLQELAAQRNSAFDRCATMAADMATLQARLVELQTKIAELEPAEPPRRVAAAAAEAEITALGVRSLSP